MTHVVAWLAIFVLGGFIAGQVAAAFFPFPDWRGEILIVVNAVVSALLWHLATRERAR